MVDVVARAKNLILDPKAEWAVIATEPTDTQRLFTGYVMIVAAIPAVATLVGAALFLGLFAGSAAFLPNVLASTLIGYALSLVGVLIMGKLIPYFAPKFDGTADPTAAMKVAAYAPTAAWVAGILFVVPMLGMIGALLGLYSIYLYYLGSIAVLRVPRERAVVFTLVLFLVAFLIFLAIGMLVSLFRF